MTKPQFVKGPKRHSRRKISLTMPYVIGNVRSLNNLIGKRTVVAAAVIPISIY